jgi:hypothetical protein
MVVFDHDVRLTWVLASAFFGHSISCFDGWPASSERAIGSSSAPSLNKFCSPSTSSTTCMEIALSYRVQSQPAFPFSARQYHAPLVCGRTLRPEH